MKFTGTKCGQPAFCQSHSKSGGKNTGDMASRKSSWRTIIKITISLLALVGRIEPGAMRCGIRMEIRFPPADDDEKQGDELEQRGGEQ